MPALKEKITETMRTALRAGDKQRLRALRLILSEIKNREIDQGEALSDAQVLTALDKMAKQCSESINQFKAAARLELVAQEEAELAVIRTFLPRPLSTAEVDALINTALQTVSAQSIRDMGKVMAWLKPKAQGRTDMTALAARIKSHLSQPPNSP